MFQVNSLDVCHQTGITSFEIKFDIGQGVKTDSGSFMNKLDAEGYIHKSKVAYIRVMFERYVGHACILFETGDSDYYMNTGKLTALERCKKYNQWFDGKDLPVICKVILSLEDDMRKILPKPSNSSHSSSESKIIDMMIFCKGEMKNYPQTNKQSLIAAK